MSFLLIFQCLNARQLPFAEFDCYKRVGDGSDNQRNQISSKKKRQNVILLGFSWGPAVLETSILSAIVADCRNHDKRHGEGCRKNPSRYQTHFKNFVGENTSHWKPYDDTSIQADKDETNYRASNGEDLNRVNELTQNCSHNCIKPLQSDIQPFQNVREHASH